MAPDWLDVSFTARHRRWGISSEVTGEQELGWVCTIILSVLFRRPTHATCFTIGVQHLFLLPRWRSGFVLLIAGADDGIEEIEGGGIILMCVQTRTGIKFVLTWVLILVRLFYLSSDIISNTSIVTYVSHPIFHSPFYCTTKSDEIVPSREHPD